MPINCEWSALTPANVEAINAAADNAAGANDGASDDTSRYR
jgi:hypothetical protein